jgi:hypothetical protein
LRRGRTTAEGSMATIEMMIDPVLMDIETSFESERMFV